MRPLVDARELHGDFGADFVTANADRGADSGVQIRWASVPTGGHGPDGFLHDA